MSYQSEQDSCLRRLLREAEENEYGGEVGVPEAQAIQDLLSELMVLRPVAKAVAEQAQKWQALFGDRQ
jgi:hypothetical protein